MADGQQAWQLAGRGPEAYERYLVPAFFAPCAERLLDAAEVAPGERVLDAACGTGAVARGAAARVGSLGGVTGVDLNSGMVEVARSATAGVTQPAIDWHTGDMTALPFPDETFDVVCCQQGFQFVGDQPGALREMRRVLVPDGRVAVAVWRPIEHNPAFVALVNELERHSGAAAAATMRSPFGGPGPDRLRWLLTDAGLRDAWIGITILTVRFGSAEEFLTQESVSSPLAEPLSALDAGGWQALLEGLDAALQPYADDDGLTFPMQSWLATARR
ncbi:methyltransferase domain-containing protein [Actinopolymorpha sp. B17G11]|uniref:class I SAM-dependent methyltransferase n=1 Tax=Actinopolymorpha sp. B17G11 TaxID=3160861 RepID=UPI0032E4680F